MALKLKDNEALALKSLKDTLCRSMTFSISASLVQKSRVWIRRIQISMS